MSDDVRQLDDCLSVRDPAPFVEDVRGRGARGRALRHAALRRLRGPAAPQRARPSQRRSARAGRASSCSFPRSRPTLAGPAADPHRGGHGLRRLRRRASWRPPCGPGPTRPDLPQRPDEGRRLLERAIRAGVRITLDSAPSWSAHARSPTRLGERARVRLRFRPDLVGRDEPSEMSPAGALGPRTRSSATRRASRPRTSSRSASAEIRDPALDLRRDPPAPRPPLDRSGGLARGDRLPGRAAAPAARPTGAAGRRASSTSAAAIPTPRDPFGRLAAAARRRPRARPGDRSPTPRRSAPASPRGLERLGIGPGRGPASRSSPAGRSTRTPASTWRRSATSSGRRQPSRSPGSRPTPPTPTSPTSTSSSTAGPACPPGTRTERPHWWPTSPAGPARST